MEDYSQYYEARQHLNLSQMAFDVIDNDRFIFQSKPSFAGMLNRVFEMYRDYADAAVDSACDAFVTTLKNELSSIPESPIKSDIIKILRSARKDELIRTVQSYPKEHPFKFQLNRENYAFLYNWRDTEDAYDGVPGKFIKAVIEEYARKPMVERESIIFRDLIDLVNDAIETHRQITLSLNSGARYSVKPYCVCTDQGYNYHYLAGFAKDPIGTGEERPVSFRISNIRIFRKTGKSGRLTEQQKKEVQNQIRTVGVQFLLQDPENVQVILSERGRKMYESQLHLRPPYGSRRQNPDGSWLYDFSCTPIQAEYYFFKFGADAEIQNPEALKTKFQKQYAEALEVYTD